MMTFHVKLLSQGASNREIISSEKVSNATKEEQATKTIQHTGFENFQLVQIPRSCSATQLAGN